MGENTASIGCLSDAFSLGLGSTPMEKMPHSADRCSNMPLPFRRYREAATGCRDQFVVACLGSFVCVAVVVVVLAWHARGGRRSRGRVVAPVSSNSYLVSSFYSVWLSLACSRHVTGSFASQNLTYFAPTRQWFPERTISSQATCCNVLNNDAPIALYLY